MFAGAGTIARPNPESIAGIADAVDPAVFHATYHAAMDAVINQHGWNLFWIGLITVVAAVFIWHKSLPAAFIASFVGGLADVGYFIFMDLDGFVHVFPGAVVEIATLLFIPWNRYVLQQDLSGQNAG